MTTDRTALEAARDALPPLPEPFAVVQYGPRHCFSADQMRDYARDTLLQAVAIHQDAALAALSSPPVLPPVAWCELTLDGKSIAHFDGKPMVMVGPVGNECHPHALYLAAPQSAAPALDDARDADRQLMRFYSVESLHALIDAQERHIVKLQAKLPPLRDEFPRTPREG